MHPVKSFSPLICTGCRHTLSRSVFHDKTNENPFRRLSGPETSPPRQGRSSAQNISKDGGTNRDNHHAEEAGGMTRRLAQITDESLEQGGRSAQNAIKEGGFSEELKRRLEAKILDSKFKSDNPAAFAQLSVAVRRVPLILVVILILADDNQAWCRSRDSGYSRCATMDRYRGRRRCGSTDVDGCPQTSPWHRFGKNSQSRRTKDQRGHADEESRPQIPRPTASQCPRSHFSICPQSRPVLVGA